MRSYAKRLAPGGKSEPSQSLDVGLNSQPTRSVGHSDRGQSLRLSCWLLICWLFVVPLWSVGRERTTSWWAYSWTNGRARRGEIMPSTARTYQSDLREFAKFAPKDPAKITRSHVAKFLEKPDLSLGTRRKRWQTLSLFVRFLRDEKLVNRDLMKGFPGPKPQHKLPRNMTAQECAAWIDAAKDSREVVMMLLGLQCGLRRTEMIGVNLADINISERSLLVRIETTKGHRERVVYLPDEVVEAIEKYVWDHPLGSGSGPLLRSFKPPYGGLSPSYLSHLMRASFRRAGLKHAPRDRFTIHAARHTMATDLLKGGAPLTVVRDALGHANISTTSVYLHASAADLAEAMEGRTYAEVTI